MGAPYFFVYGLFLGGWYLVDRTPWWLAAFGIAVEVGLALLLILLVDGKNPQTRTRDKT